MVNDVKPQPHSSNVKAVINLFYLLSTLCTLKYNVFN